MRLRMLSVNVCLFMFWSVSTMAAQVDNAAGTTVFVRGLVMIGLNGPDALQIAIPDAKGHTAQLTVVTQSGEKRAFSIPKGPATLSALQSATGKPVIRVPQLVRVQELYGTGVSVNLRSARNVITIPWTSVADVSAEQVSNDRYTFTRTDTGEDIETFRPRQIAESLRIDLERNPVLKFTNNQTVDLAGAKEIWIEYVPTDIDPKAYEDHFHFYHHYLVLPTNKTFQVQPRKMSGLARAVPRPPMMRAFFPLPYQCYPLGF